MLFRSDGVALREIAGGCVCCAAQTQLRVGLTQLLRTAKPDRLLIEPSGLGHPAGVIDALRDPWLASAVELRAVLCIADIRQFLDPRSAAVDTYRDQVALADVLVGSKADLASDAERADFRARAADLYPRKAAVVESVRGRRSEEHTS